LAVDAKQATNAMRDQLNTHDHEIAALFDRLNIKRN
jgi:hypothetical protein